MIKTSLVVKTLSNQTPDQNDHPKKSKKPPSSPSNGGDHAGEIDLAIEDNALAWLHLFMITMVIVISDDSDGDDGDDDGEDGDGGGVDQLSL